MSLLTFALPLRCPEAPWHRPGQPPGRAEPAETRPLPRREPRQPYLHVCQAAFAPLAALPIRMR